MLTANKGVFKSLESLEKLCENGKLHDALRAVDHMQQHGICISTEIYYFLIKECINKKNLILGRELHHLIIRSGVETDVFLGSHLIRLFGLCESLFDVNQVFSKLPNPNIFAWCVTISAYANLGHIDRAFGLYYQMQEQGVKPNDYVFTTLLKSCASKLALVHGKLIHDHVIKSGSSMIIEANALIDMYAKCGSMDDARRVFDKLPKRNVVTWTAMISGYAQLRHGHEALHLFQQMKQEGTEPNHITYVSILKACASIAALCEGKLIHAQIIKYGFASTGMIGNSLIDMYAKCGSFKDARVVFDKLANKNLVSRTAIITGYVQHGHDKQVNQLFEQMQEVGMQPDKVMFLTSLRVCARMSNLDHGRLLHAYIMKSGFESDINVGSTLINMYTNCGNIDDAHRVFNSLPEHNAVSWTAMIAGYAQHGHCHEALLLFQNMQQQGMEPDDVTFLSTLKACPSIAALDNGKTIHAQIIENGFDSQVNLGSALVDFYCKCGNLEDAHKVFDMLPRPDIVTYTSMIAGCTEHRHYNLALLCFEGMEREKLKPDHVTYVCVLSACSHMGLVDQGCHLFKSMREDHDSLPTLDHYDCMLNLLGHAGHLTKAEALLQTMPFAHHNSGWISLLNHCETYGNVELGRKCFNHIVAANGTDAATYVLMSNIYTHSGMLADADKIEDLRRCAQVWKDPGRAFIEVDNKVHDFTVGDKSHLQNDDINAKLKALYVQMAEGGHMPHIGFVL